MLALLFQERGGKAVQAHLPGSLLAAVNLSEVVSKSVEAGMTLEEAVRVAEGISCEIVPLDAELAYLTASLRVPTRTYGLSLADRACLALGLKLRLPVVTADRAWQQCDVGVEVISIR